MSDERSIRKIMEDHWCVSRGLPLGSLPPDSYAGAELEGLVQDLERVQPRHACQYCDGPLNATRGLGIYECPRCVETFPDGHGYDEELRLAGEEALLRSFYYVDGEAQETFELYIFVYRDGQVNTPWDELPGPWQQLWRDFVRTGDRRVLRFGSCWVPAP